MSSLRPATAISCRSLLGLSGLTSNRTPFVFVNVAARPERPTKYGGIEIKRVLTVAYAQESALFALVRPVSQLKFG